MSGNGFKRDMGPGAVTFRDRVDTMTRWFREWSPCEQTIAVYSLIYQLSPSHVRFLSTVMDAYLQEHSDEVKQLEGEANDPGECPHTLRPLVHTQTHTRYACPPARPPPPHAYSFYQLSVRLQRGTSVGEYPRAPPATEAGQRRRSEGVHEPSPEGAAGMSRGHHVPG